MDDRDSCWLRGRQYLPPSPALKSGRAAPRRAANLLHGITRIVKDVLMWLQTLWPFLVFPVDIKRYRATVCATMLIGFANATEGRRLTTCKWDQPSWRMLVHASYLHAEPSAALEGQAVSRARRIVCWLSTFYATSKWWHRVRTSSFRKRKTRWLITHHLPHRHTHKHTPQKRRKNIWELCACVYVWLDRSQGCTAAVLQLLQVCDEHCKASLCHYRAAMLLGN